MKITHQNASIISKFLGEHASEPPSISAADIIYESSHFLLRIPSEYQPKRFNCSKFSKILQGVLRLHSKRVPTYIL